MNKYIIIIFRILFVNIKFVVLADKIMDLFIVKEFFIIIN